MRLPRSLRRRALGCVWFAAWSGVLWGVVYPWTRLGGVVSDRLRWFEWFALAVGLLAGHAAGSYGREVARPGLDRNHLWLLRVTILPTAGIAAAAMLVLRIEGNPDPIGVVLTALLAVWAGVDLGYAVLPLLDDREWSLRGPVPLEVEEDADEFDERFPGFF